MLNRYLVGIIFLLGGALVFPQSGYSQGEIGLHFQRQVWQANASNPAFLPTSRLVIALPGLTGGISNSSFSYRDLVNTDGTGNAVLDIDRVISQLDSNNYLREQADFSTLAIGVRAGNALFSLGHQIRTLGWADYPLTLAELAWRGNAQFIGKTIDFGPDFQAQVFHEFFLGLAVPLRADGNISIGGRLKLFNGIGDLSTSRRSLKLLTAADAYQLSLESDFVVNTTGAIKYNGIDDVRLGWEDGNFSIRDVWTGNWGLGMDLGLYARFDRFDLAFSVLDIGSIRWKDKVENFTLTGIQTFSGIDILGQVLADSLAFGEAIDTLVNTYDFTITNEAYSTRLPFRMLASASAFLTEKISVGGFVYTERQRGQWFPALGLNATWSPLSWIGVGALYSLRNKGQSYLGLNTALTLGPLQLVAATDHLPILWNAEKSRSFNARLGANIVLGRFEPPRDRRAEERFF